jgi:hypothetical protein
MIALKEQVADEAMATSAKQSGPAPATEAQMKVRPPDPPPLAVGQLQRRSYTKGKDAMSLYFPDLQRAFFFRRPDWRWQRACWLVENGRYFSCRRDDADTGRAVHYLQALARCRRGVPTAAVLRRFGDIHAARQLHQGGGPTRLLIQARILARQTSQEIYKFTGVAPEVIDTFEALFFHCREHLDAQDWVHHQCIGSMDSGSEPAHSVLFRAFAYNGGPLILEAVRPYFLDGKDLLVPPLALSTLEGRREQLVRLAVASQKLPRDAATHKKLLKIMLIVQEMERKQRSRTPPTAILAENLDFRLAELPLHAQAKPQMASETPTLAAVTEVAREAV